MVGERWAPSECRVEALVRGELPYFIEPWTLRCGARAMREAVSDSPARSAIVRSSATCDRSLEQSMHPASVVPEADLHCQGAEERAARGASFGVFTMVFTTLAAASDSELARASPGLETESAGVHVDELAAQNAREVHGELQRELRLNLTELVESRASDGEYPSTIFGSMHVGETGSVLQK